MSRAGCFPTAIFRAVDASQGLIDFIGALGGIRTPDPQIRSLVLYPAELRAPQVCRRTGFGHCANSHGREAMLRLAPRVKRADRSARARRT